MSSGPARVRAMNPGSRDLARDPQDLAGLLVFRANASDVEGMVALYEPDTALACGDGRIAIRKFYTGLLATGPTFDLGQQRPAMLRENLALTSTRLPNGIVTAEVALTAHRQNRTASDPKVTIYSKTLFFGLALSP